MLDEENEWMRNKEYKLEDHSVVSCPIECHVTVQTPEILEKIARWNKKLYTSKQNIKMASLLRRMWTEWNAHGALAISKLVQIIWSHFHSNYL